MKQILANTIRRTGIALICGLLLAATVLVPSGSVFAQLSSGPNNPGTTANDTTVGTVAWTNTANVQSSDNTYATASLGNSATSNYIKATNFGFSLPSTATIVGIVVEVERHASAATRVYDNSIRLVKGGTIGGNDKGTGTGGTAWANGDPNTYVTYGSSSDLWGLAWTYSDINASTFGVVVSAIRNNLGANITASVDHIRITVHYIIPPTVTTQAATSVEETTATLNGNITATGGVNPTVRGFDWDVDSGEPYASAWTETGSYGTGAFTYASGTFIKGTVYYYRAKAQNTGGWSYGSEVQFLTKPDEPNTFTATAGNQQVQLSWVKGTGAQYTIIRGKIGSYPTSYNTDVDVYNGTGTGTTHSGLTNGDHWYYRAWSYTTANSLEQYSDLYAQADATPAAGAADIANAPTSYGFGTVHEGVPADTGLSYFTITNNSAFAINITLGGTDMTGGAATWTLSDDGSSGTNIFGLYAGLEGGSFNIVVKKNAPYNTLKTGLAGSGGTQKWGLKLITPSTFTDGGQKSGTVTITATQQ
jgi:hypothetical protein